MLIPAGLEWYGALALLGLSVVCSAITATLGAGGGLLMLSALVNILPLQAVIPVHGLVQLGSNGGRAWMARRAVQWQLVRPFLIGGVAGAVLGTLMLRQLPTSVLQLSIGLFVLWNCWSPFRAPRWLSTRRMLPLSGGVVVPLSLFVGAVGPLVLATLQRLVPDRTSLVATAAVMVTGVNLLKIAAFGVVGFDAFAWLVFTAAMIAAGLLGTWLGLRLLRRMAEDHFRSALKWLLTLLALRMLWQGAQAIVAG